MTFDLADVFVGSAAVSMSTSARPTGSSPLECEVSKDGRVVREAGVAVKAGEVPGGPSVLANKAARSHASIVGRRA